MIICVTGRDEPQLQLGRTLSSIAEHLPEYDTVVFDDGSQKPLMAPETYRLDGNGIGQARHAAIMLAMERDHSHVLLMDSHMRVDESTAAGIDHYFGSEAIHDTDLACFRCDAIGEDWEWGDPRGYGARVARLHGTPKVGPNSEVRRLWQSEWTNTEQAKNTYELGMANVIGELLGAAYIIPVARYIELGCPWETHKGWGTSEATISIPHICLGGLIWCLPGRAGHLFGTHDRKKRGLTSQYAFQAAEYYHNQIRLAIACGLDIDKETEYLLGTYHGLADYKTIINEGYRMAYGDRWAVNMREHIKLTDYADKWGMKL